MIIIPFCKKERRKYKMKNTLKRTLVLSLVLVALVLTLAGCSKKTKITVDVVDAAGEKTTYEIKTNAENLYDAIVEDGQITLGGYTGDYGYYLESVNGLDADYEADGAYWAIYVNDEYGMFSLDQQPIADGDNFKLAYEVFVLDDYDPETTEDASVEEVPVDDAEVEEVPVEEETEEVAE